MITSSKAIPANDNQRALTSAIHELTQQLETWSRSGQQITAVTHTAQGNLLLDRLTEIFQLSSFERRLLLAAASVELDSNFGALCARLRGDERSPYPTLDLLLGASADAHWDALSPSAPLRAWRLLSLSGGETLVSQRVRLDERILHYLVGVPCEDPSLLGLLDPHSARSTSLTKSQAEVASRAAALLSATRHRDAPVVHLIGADGATRQSVAAAAADEAGLQLARVSVPLLPTSAAELQSLSRMLDREAALSRLVLYLSLDDLDNTDAARGPAFNAFVDSLLAPLVISAPSPHKPATREMILFELAKPAPAEQSVLWQNALGPHAGLLNGSLDRLSSHFHLSSEKIQRNSSAALALVRERQSKESTAGDQDGSHLLADTLWDICRTQSRVHMDHLAQRVEGDATWHDLVLPAKEIEALKQISSQMQHRLRVQTWGFKSFGGRGMGLTAIFAGVSGTGKTLAAEVLGHELRLDLFRVDLSQTVSKYIGETARNLRRIFDTAEEAGAILLFDEADALFGKRTEVRDSHDKYANTEVSYLLQRMELYRGLAILSTNMKQAIDSAFLRRVRFVVQFPFPDATLRESLWRKAVPPEAPTEALDYTALARLSVTGANIRSIALNGAFLAAAESGPIRMAHLLESARAEAAKLERPLAQQEVRGWV